MFNIHNKLNSDPFSKHSSYITHFGPLMGDGTDNKHTYLIAFTHPMVRYLGVSMCPT